MENYSVLMSVHINENAEHFAASIQSLLDQTVVTNDFVIVCDGPLSKELNKVLEEYDSRYPGLFHIVRLTENVGVGLAAKAGLAVCRNDLIAKMDSDDISLPDRCRMQLSRFSENPDLALIGGVIEEFDNRTGKVFAVRTVPEENSAIRTYARRRSPFNNVTVMYRKSAAEAAGGYRDLRRGEDYDLYLRMLIDGCYAQNLPQTLVRVRVDSDTHRRRASWSAMKGCAGIWWHAYRVGYSSLSDLLICLCGQMFLVICPGRVQQMLYKRFLRKQIEE